MEGFYGSGLERTHNNASTHILLARLSHMAPPKLGEREFEDVFPKKKDILPV